LKVKDINDLRKKCRETEVDYLVVKKTLLKKTLSASGLDGQLVDNFQGGIAAAFGTDEVTPAKTLNDFSKDHPALVCLGGFLEKKYFNQEQVLALAKLPSKQELLAQMVGSIKAPIAGFVNVLSGNLRGLVRVLEAIRGSK
jgi:large subunit ribosomal protein L10